MQPDWFWGDLAGGAATARKLITARPGRRFLFLRSVLVRSVVIVKVGG